MTNLALPYRIAITIQNNGQIVAACRDGSNVLVPGPYSVTVNAAFDATSPNPRSRPGGTTAIDVGGVGNGNVAVVGPKGWARIILTCRADGSIISSCKDSAGNLIPGPYVVAVNMAFNAVAPQPIRIAGQAAIGDSFPSQAGWPPNIVTRLAAGSSVQDLQDAITAASAGQTVACDGGTYALGSTNITLKSGVNLYASVPTTFTGTGHFDGSHLSNWTITSPDNGQNPNSGFTFNGPFVLADYATNFRIINNIFLNQAGRYPTGGDAVSVEHAQFGYIVNNDFTGSAQNVIGLNDVDNMTHDGNRFYSNNQSYSYHNNYPTNHNRGRNCRWFNEYHERPGRACIEVGPTQDNNFQAFDNAQVVNCMFVDFNNAGTPDGTLAISLVGLASLNTNVSNCFIDRGDLPNVRGDVCVACEVPGPGLYTGITILNFCYAGFCYTQGAQVTGCSWYVVPNNPDYPKFGPGGSAGGWQVGSGGQSANIHDNTTLTVAPARPPKPARVASATYYP